MGSDLLCHEAGTDVRGVGVPFVTDDPPGIDDLGIGVPEGLFEGNAKPDLIIEIPHIVLNGILDPGLRDAFLGVFISVLGLPFGLSFGLELDCFPVGVSGRDYSAVHLPIQFSGLHLRDCGLST